MVEHQSHPKKMENLNIIIEINEEGEMSDFDISLRNELPYKNTEEYEYVVEEFEKVKEVNHKKLRCLLARELNCFACSAIYRFQLVFVRRRRKAPANNVQYVVVNQRKPANQQSATHHQPHTPPVTKTVRVIPKAPGTNAVIPVAASTAPVRAPPMKKQHITPKTISVNETSRMSEVKGKEVKTVKLAQNKSIAVAAQNTVRGRAPQNFGPRRSEPQITDLGSSEEDIETEVIDSSMVEVQIESSSSPKPMHQRPKTDPFGRQTPPNIKVEDDSSLRCDLCNKEFHSARQRQRHLIVHLEQNNVMNCKKCNKGFLDKSELLAHERTHSNVKGPRKSHPGGGGGGQKRKQHTEEEQVLMEMTVTEEEIIEPDGMYIEH